MELIRISDHKLKIMLTPTDMRHFELNAATFGEDQAQMHRAFRLLLEEIRRQTDFDADDNRISVQYFPSREGGCEMFISHLPPIEETEEKSGQRLPCVRETHKCRRRVSTEGFARECVYRFAGMPELLAVCRRLSALGYEGESRAYRDDMGSYYLFLSVLAPSPFSTPEELSFLVEYGSIESYSVQKTYLCEHGQEITSEDAVHRLGALA